MALKPLLLLSLLLLLTVAAPFLAARALAAPAPASGKVSTSSVILPPLCPSDCINDYRALLDSWGQWPYIFWNDTKAGYAKFSKLRSEVACVNYCRTYSPNSDYFEFTKSGIDLYRIGGDCNCFPKCIGIFWKKYSTVHITGGKLSAC